MPSTFEENYQEIIDVVTKYHTKWRLDILHWMDYDDVKSEVVTHVWKKWHLWDQSRPLAPWVAQVCQRQILNKLRNHYTNYARPCIKCPHNLEGNYCAVTSNHEQCSECPLYARWMESKKNGYDIKMPLELENHAAEVNNMPSDEVDYDFAIKKLSVELGKHLDEKTLRAYFMLNFEHQEDKDVAAYLGFKPRPQNSVAKQMTEFKASLFDRVREIVRESDIPEMWR